MQGLYNGFVKQVNEEHDELDSLVKEWTFIGNVTKSDSMYVYIRLDSSYNVSMPLPKAYIPQFEIIESDSTIYIKLSRLKYPSLYRHIGKQVVKKHSSDFIQVENESINLLH